MSTLDATLAERHKALADLEREAASWRAQRDIARIRYARMLGAARRARAAGISVSAISRTTQLSRSSLYNAGINATPEPTSEPSVAG